VRKADTGKHLVRVAWGPTKRYLEHPARRPVGSVAPRVLVSKSPGGWDRGTVSGRSPDWLKVENPGGA